MSVRMLAGWRNPTRFLGTRPPLAVEEGSRAPVERLLESYERQVHARANLLFQWVLPLQWLLAVGIAAVFSPLAWAGATSSVHPHLVGALGLGLLLVVPPLLLVRWYPNAVTTRHAVAVAQVGFSALLIHLSGGRIETHFHVFGSLAFIALYRDWRVLVTATVVVAVDHLARGLWYPESVYGVSFASAWRTLEHAAWVAFEVGVLIWYCIVSRQEMTEICQHQSRNEELLNQLDHRVRDRTLALETEMQERMRASRELQQSEERYRQLITNASVGIFETTQGGAILFANPYIRRCLGLPSTGRLEGGNETLGGIWMGDDRQRFWEKLQKTGELRGYEVRFRTATGGTVNMLMNVRLQPQQPGGPLICEGTAEDITERVRAQSEVEQLNRQLLDASRRAGMAEVATGVLHNVGNVLTSVNLIVHDLQERLHGNRLPHLERAAGMLQGEPAQVAEFLTHDETGRQLPGFISRLSAHFVDEKKKFEADLEKLAGHFVHIRDIIVTQQSSARMLGMIENVPPLLLIEDALRLSAQSFERHGIAVVKDFAVTGSVQADRHKVLQILVNLLRNAKDALRECPDARITLTIAPGAEGFVQLAVSDNGIGIPAENLAKLFQHGFTTKPDGHGFGLHSCVLAAREMKGDLAASSDGPGCGATFTLSLPLAP